MKFTDALQVAHQIPWSYVNTFEVYFAWNYKMLNNTFDQAARVVDMVDYDNDAKGGHNVLGWNPKDNERLSLHLINLNLPTLTSNELNTWVGNRWSRANGQQQQYTFDMTFRDSNQMEFYRLFSTQYREQQYRYFDDYTFNVFVAKDSDYGDKYHNDTTGYAKSSWRAINLVSLKRCSIQSIGPIQFSNATENQHVEFTVQFVANDIELYDTGARQFYGVGESSADGSKGGYDYAKQMDRIDKWLPYRNRQSGGTTMNI